LVPKVDNDPLHQGLFLMPDSNFFIKYTNINESPDQAFSSFVLRANQPSDAGTKLPLKASLLQVRMVVQEEKSHERNA
jgi:hypothetical protein